jgi:hypothetical protein
MLNVYLAQGMTGYKKSEQVQLAKHAVGVFASRGIATLSPVLEEGVKDEPGVVTNNSVDLDWKWYGLDKPALKYKCFVLCVLTADLKSFGCEREQMLMRGCYFRPMVIVSPRHAAGYKSIANKEDDYIAGSVEEAAAYIDVMWGTWMKRRKWQMKMYSGSILKWVGIHLWGLTL